MTTPSKAKFTKLDGSEFDSPEKDALSSPAGATFKKLDASEFDNSDKACSSSPMEPLFKRADTSGIESPGEDRSWSSLAFKKYVGSSPLAPKTSNQPISGSPLSPIAAFKSYAIEGDLAKRTQDIIQRPLNNFDKSFTQIVDDDDIFREDHCPMCRKPVDPNELKKRGDMNTRQQEKFCREHQQSDAKRDWTSRGYPEIDWDILDARISQHHAFIRKLVNGANSHYRSILDKTVRAGKDRTLLKSKTTLTPGYYGTRGLQVISESIMHEFTPLLKKRAVKDRLMTARGVTGYVQSVLVPEVTVLLIKEDMNITIDEARGVLKESVTVGELVHEEIRDVVTKRREDSDGEGRDGEGYE